MYKYVMMDTVDLPKKIFLAYWDCFGFFFIFDMSDNLICLCRCGDIFFFHGAGVGGVRKKEVCVCCKWEKLKKVNEIGEKV